MERKVNVWLLLLTTGILIGVLVLLAWFTDPSRIERRFIKRMTASLETFNVAIATALIPAFQQATVAIGDFAAALAKAKALDPEGWDRLDRETL